MSIQETLQQIHDEANHIFTTAKKNRKESLRKGNYKQYMKEGVILLNANTIWQKAKQALQELNKSQTLLKVKKWIRCGELYSKNRTQEAILEECGRILDKSYAYNILEDVLFKTTNGKYYVITVEALF